MRWKYFKYKLNRNQVQMRKKICIFKDSSLGNAITIHKQCIEPNGHCLPNVLLRKRPWNTMCRDSFNTRKEKTKQINPPDPSPSALQTGLFTITTNSCLQVTMTTGSVWVSSESRKTDTFQGQTQCLKKKKAPHPALLYKQVIEYQPKFEVPSVLRLELGPP